MVRRKRKKKSRHRGSRRHGGGQKNRRRGSGNRGGVGNAGSFKRADTIRSYHHNIGTKFGSQGFVSMRKDLSLFENISMIDKHLDKFLEEGLIKKEGKYFVIDGDNFPFDKLLGSGQVNNKYLVKNMKLSKKAKEKIVDVGGKIEESED